VEVVVVVVLSLRLVWAEQAGKVKQRGSSLSFQGQREPARVAKGQARSGHLTAVDFGEAAAMPNWLPVAGHIRAPCDSDV